MLAVLDRHVILCSEMIKNDVQKEKLIAELISSECNSHTRELIDISEEECLDMGANVVFSKDKNKNSCIIVSERALVNYRREIKALLAKNYKIIKVDLTILEKISGASAKSILSEIN
mmetsp:Transcript_42834/g.50227  ORF Transcript_42834/g.50227 Transcript_42834/m.50227 type:complete len:117 (-) Transcript_42834:7-357(-)